ncbi:MAG: ribonuclease P protein component [Puniceicoccales bacterium]|nr:ribonuclease P protein component [Puniceicoccales bacterium]
MNKRHRLTRTRDFQNIYRSGMRTYVNGMSIFFALSSFNRESRLGIVVSRKIGTAVVRNQFKRRVRVCFDRLRNRFRFVFDLIVMARTPAAALLTLCEIEQNVWEVFQPTDTRRGAASVNLS